MFTCAFSLEALFFWTMLGGALPLGRAFRQRRHADARRLTFGKSERSMT